MSTVKACEAMARLPRLLRAAECGETVVITRYGKPVAQICPVRGQRRDEVPAVIERIRRGRAGRAAVTLGEILAWRHQGHDH